jgi:hypothetical protein
MFAGALTDKGYGRVTVAPNRTDYAHRVVCRIYHGDPPTPLHEVAHACGVRACVNPNHLRWATRSDNAHDRVDHGTDIRGERAPSNKLTAVEVAAIRRALLSGEKERTLADEHGVARTTIQCIGNGRTWGWLEVAS